MIWLAPLTHANLEAPWNDTVYETDASTSGYGVVTTPSNHAEITAEVQRAWEGRTPSDFGTTLEKEGDDTPTEDAMRRLVGSPSVEEESNEPFRVRAADLFCGEGGFGRAVEDSCRFEVDFYDVRRWRKQGFLRPRLFRVAKQKILSLYWILIHLAPPCATWFTARIPRLRRPGRYILGLPNLTPLQRQRLREGIQLMWIATQLATAAVEAGIGFTLENPASSMCWGWGEMLKLLAMPGIYVIRLVYCSYGVPWKKATIIVTNGAECK